MVVKVRFLKDKDVLNTSLTDWAQLGGIKKPQRLILADLPSVLVRPQGEQAGKIRYHGKKLNLSKDNTFFYGAWPQKKVLPVWQEKLNQALLNGKIRSHYGHYYTLNGQACQEYLFGKKSVKIYQGLWIIAVFHLLTAHAFMSTRIRDRDIILHGESDCITTDVKR